MMRSNLLISLYAGAVAYLLSAFLLGPTGIESLRKLERYRDELVGHMDELERIGTGLEAAVHDLEANPERIRLEARRLQYFAAGEKIIKIEGYNGPASRLTPGGLLLPRSIEQTPPAIQRAIALGAALATFIVLSMLREGGLLQRRRTHTASRE
jgi:hypothetical protein